MLTKFIAYKALYFDGKDEWKSFEKVDDIEASDKQNEDFKQRPEVFVSSWVLIQTFSHSFVGLKNAKSCFEVSIWSFSYSQQMDGGNLRMATEPCTDADFYWKS